MQVTENLLKYNNRVKDNHKDHIRLEGILNRFLLSERYCRWVTCHVRSVRFHSPYNYSRIVLSVTTDGCIVFAYYTWSDEGQSRAFVEAVSYKRLHSLPM